MVIAGGLSVLVVRRVAPSWWKGKVGERRVRRLLARLDPSRYTVFHGLYLPVGSSGTTELDHVVVSPHGVFVIETKNYSGMIFASPGDRSWTVTYPGGARRQIPSPVRQNRGHAKALARFLPVDQVAVTPLVVLVGSAGLLSDPGPEVVGKDQLLASIEARADARWPPPPLRPAATSCAGNRRRWRAPT